MELKQMIMTSSPQNAALGEGSIYRRLKEHYAGARLVFGLVTSLMNNGQDVAISAIEIDPEETDYTMLRTVAFTAEDSKQIFVASIDEINLVRERVYENLDRNLRNAETQLARLQNSRATADTIFEHIDKQNRQPELLGGIVEDAQ